MNLAPIILATLAISAFAAVPLKLPQDHDVDAFLSSVVDVQAEERVKPSYVCQVPSPSLVPSASDCPDGSVPLNDASVGMALPNSKADCDDDFCTNMPLMETVLRSMWNGYKSVQDCEAEHGTVWADLYTYCGYKDRDDIHYVPGKAVKYGFGTLPLEDRTGGQGLFCFASSDISNTETNGKSIACKQGTWVDHLRIDKFYTTASPTPPTPTPTTASPTPPTPSPDGSCHSIYSGWDDAKCESTCNVATCGEKAIEKCDNKCSSSCACFGATATPTTATPTTADYHPDCADCSGRQRASTEGDDCQNSDGASCAGKSFCYRRDGELASDAAACDKYWGEVVGGGDTRFECEMKDNSCEVVTPCCAGTAIN